MPTKYIPNVSMDAIGFQWTNSFWSLKSIDNSIKKKYICKHTWARRGGGGGGGPPPPRRRKFWLTRHPKKHGGGPGGGVIFGRRRRPKIFLPPLGRPFFTKSPPRWKNFGQSLLINYPPGKKFFDLPPPQAPAPGGKFFGRKCEFLVTNWKKDIAGNLLTKG